MFAMATHMQVAHEALAQCEAGIGRREDVSLGLRICVCGKPLDGRVAGAKQTGEPPEQIPTTAHCCAWVIEPSAVRGRITRCTSSIEARVPRLSVFNVDQEGDKFNLERLKDRYMWEYCHALGMDDGNTEIRC